MSILDENRPVRILFCPVLYFRNFSRNCPRSSSKIAPKVSAAIYAEDFLQIHTELTSKTLPVKCMSVSRTTCRYSSRCSLRNLCRNAFEIHTGAFLKEFFFEFFKKYLGKILKEFTQELFRSFSRSFSDYLSRNTFKNNCRSLFKNCIRSCFKGYSRRLLYGFP